MKKLAALLLCLVLVLSFALAGCGSDTVDTDKPESKASDVESKAADEKPTIVGKWSIELNFNDYLPAESKAAFEAQGISADAFKDVKIVVASEFTEDGKYTTGVDKDSITKISDVAKSAIFDAAKAQIKAAAEAAGVTYDEYVKLFEQQMNTTLDDYINNSMGGVDFSQMLGGEIVAKYELDGDKLYTSDSADSDISKDKYEKIELAADKLTILAAYENGQEVTNSMYPATFKKVK